MLELTFIHSQTQVRHYADHPQLSLDVEPALFLRIG